MTDSLDSKYFSIFVLNSFIMAAVIESDSVHTSRNSAFVRAKVLPRAILR